MHSAADDYASGHSGIHNMATVGGCYMFVRSKPPKSADALAEDYESPQPGRFRACGNFLFIHLALLLLCGVATGIACVLAEGP
jgi:hypothetical protein